MTENETIALPVAPSLSVAVAVTESGPSAETLAFAVYGGAVTVLSGLPSSWKSTFVTTPSGSNAVAWIVKVAGVMNCVLAIGFWMATCGGAFAAKVTSIVLSEAAVLPFVSVAVAESVYRPGVGGLNTAL